LSFRAERSEAEESLQLRTLRDPSARPLASVGMTVANDEHILFTCSDGNLIEALELQMEGKKPMLAKEFANGYKSLLHA